MGNSDKFQRETSLRAWLVTILRNVYYSRYRKRAREVQDSDGVFARGIAVVGDQESHLDLADFRKALAKLPAEQREVFTMVGASGLSYEEVTVICGVEIGTIKPRQSRPNQAQRAHGARRPASGLVRPRHTRRVPIRRYARSGRTWEIGYLLNSNAPQILPCAKELSTRERVVIYHPFGIVALAAKGEAALREGRRPRSVAQIEDIGGLGAADPLRKVSAWSLATLAALAAVCALYFARDLILPIVAAFVVGVMSSPLAQRLEALRMPRPVAALLIVCGVALLIALVIALIVPRVSELTTGLPALAASLKEKLHAFDGLLGFWHRLTSTGGSGPTSDAVALPLPSLEWVPSTIGILLPPITGFLFFLVVLLLFIAKWPDLRRGLVMTFARRDSRLTVLKILNEIEAGLARYLLTVTLVNLTVGAMTGVICALTGMSHAIGFVALAATLNFIPVVGPIATFVVLVLVGVVTAPTFAEGLVPAAGFALLIVVEGQFVTPTIIGRQLELNALAVLLSLAFWTWLWGPLGAFLSSPILIVALILKERLYTEEER